MSGPGPVAFVDASAPVTRALFTDPGTYVLQLAASDGYLTVADRATITVDPAPNLTGGSLVVALGSPSPLTTGATETVTATLRNAAAAPIPDFPIVLTVAGANPMQTTAITNAAGVATFPYVGTRAGTDLIGATAFAPTFQLDSPIVSLTWNDPPAGGPLLTQGWIASPLHQSTLMERVPVVLSNQITMTSGTLTYWPAAHPTEVHTLATGLTGGPGATLATLDTTLLANGSYVVQLDGVDDANHQRQSQVLVIVAGDYKPGRVVVEVTDFTVPIAGMPITVGRRYDSLEKDRVGDFGYGWSLVLGSPKLEVDPGHNVTLTLPNGRRATFNFAPTFPAVGLVGIGFLLLPAYAPAPGVFGSLTADGCQVLMVNLGAYPLALSCFLALSLEELEYAPTKYTYTDPYGTAYVMGATGELKSITDRQGNSLTFQPNGIGIISSSGKSVTFVRDDQNRITKVDYPAHSFALGEFGAAQYTYDDVTGDLTKVQLPTSGNALSIYKHTYDQHRLLTTVDPRNNAVRTSTYDPVDGRLIKDKDALNNETTYTYDLATRTNTTRFVDTGVISQTFDARGLVVSETDQRNNTTTHEYDANRNETKRTNALGEETTATYDAFGNQTSVTDPTGTTHTTYNQLNLPVTFTDRMGHVTTIDYDDRGVPSRFADELGTRFKFTNSEQGLPLIVEDAAGKRAYIEYDAAGNVTGRTDWLGRKTSATFDEAGHKLSETTARGATTTYSYTAQGWVNFKLQSNSYAVSTLYDANGNIYQSYDNDGSHGRTNPTFDALNHLTAEWHVDDGPGGTTVSYTHDFRGNPLTMTDELGRTTTYEYDLAGNLTKTTFPDTKYETRTYDALNRLESVTDERGPGHTTTYSYDEGCGCSDRVTTVTDPLTHATVTTYDANGRRSSVTDANLHTTSFIYDVRGHVIETHYPDGTVMYEGYDARGRRTSMTDQTGAATLYGYDDQGQLTSVTDPLNNVTAYGYDADGNLTSVTDANNHTTTYEYDLLKRKTKRTLPMGQSETFAYDLAGRQTGHTDFRGKTTTMTYDVRDRMLTKVPDPSLGEASHSYTYSRTGQRLTSIDGSGTTTYTYDDRDRLETKTAAAGKLLYNYDDAGNIGRIRSFNPDGSARANGTDVEYLWNEANQLASVKDNRVGGGAMTTATYTSTNRPATLAQPNGVGLTYSYDALDRVTSMQWRQGTSPAFGSWAYTHNDRGQRLTSTDITSRAVTYAYDAVSRLMSETVTGDPRGVAFNGALSYVLDGTGNRLSRASTLSAVGAQSFTYNANDEISGDAFDANGNTTASGGHSYAYDFENRLVSKDGGTVTLAYDCDGNRVAKTVAGVTTRYLLDDLNPTGYLQVLEEVVGGAVEARYTYGTNLVSQTRNVSSTPATSYYGYDAHGSITFLTDSVGAVTDSYDYESWGDVIAQTGSTPNTRLYTGEELDPDLGLINLRARQYQQHSGRFLGLDPEAGRLTSPLSFNRYLYTSVDPVNFRDPLGRAELASEAGLTRIAGALQAQTTIIIGRQTVINVAVASAAAAAVTCKLYQLSTAPMFLSELDTPETIRPKDPLFKNCADTCSEECAPYLRRGAKYTRKTDGHVCTNDYRNNARYAFDCCYQDCKGYAFF